MRFLNDTRVTTLSTAHTIWNIVVRVNPLKAATATKGMVVASPTKRIIGVKNMEMRSPAAMARKRVCILKNIVCKFLMVCGRKNTKNRKSSVSLIAVNSTLHCQIWERLQILN